MHLPDPCFTLIKIYIKPVPAMATCTLKLTIPQLFNGLVWSMSRNKFLFKHHSVLLDLTNLVIVDLR